MAENEIDLSDSANLGALIHQLFETLPEAKRQLMVNWARREMETRALITRVSKRMWADEWKEEGGQVHPGGWQTVVWEMGKASPQNDAVRIFAMLMDDGLEGQGPVGKVAVFSYGMVKAKDAEELAPVFCKELVYAPDVVYGPATGEAVYRDFFDFLATPEERLAAEDLAEREIAKHAENGAAS